MAWVNPNLVDDDVLPFDQWKKALHDEDIKEFGKPIRRPMNSYVNLYGIYKDFQFSDGAIKIRKQRLAKNG